MSEKRILNSGLIALTAEPEVMAWRNNSGQAWQGTFLRIPFGATFRMKPGMVVLEDARPFRGGLIGSADVLGVAPGFGFALEAKTETGRQSDQQKKFQAAFERAGGRYGLFRSGEEAVQLLRGWRDGRS